jgi:hypothetical protein
MIWLINSAGVKGVYDCWNMSEIELKGCGGGRASIARSRHRFDRWIAKEYRKDCWNMADV